MKLIRKLNKLSAKISQIRFFLIAGCIGCLLFGQSFAESKDKAAASAALLKKVKSSQSIIYSPKTEPKAVVTVFTDLNCGYCRKLHHEIPELNDLGIELRVLAFPRHGVNSSSYNNMVSVFCSKDPKEALEKAMDGNEVKRRTCKNPVVDHMLLGHKLGVNGTPMLFFEDGTSYAGYLSASRLAREAIKRSAKEK